MVEPKSHGSCPKPFLRERTSTRFAASLGHGSDTKKRLARGISLADELAWPFVIDGDAYRAEVEAA
jgi:hypothetical protein